VSTLPASPTSFQGTDRLKFTAEEQARIRNAEQPHGYRQERAPEARPSMSLGAGLVTLIIWLLLESLVALLVVHPHSGLPMAHAVEPETRSAHSRSHVPRPRGRHRPASQRVDKPATPIASPTPIMPEDGVTAGVVIESPNQAEPIPSEGVETNTETKPREEDKVSMEATGAAPSEAQSEPKPPAVEPRDGARDAWRVGTDKQTPVKNAKSGADSFATTARASDRKEPQENRRVSAHESPRADARGITGNQPRSSPVARSYVHPCPVAPGIPAGVTLRPGEVHCFAPPHRLYFSQSFERPGWLRRFLGAQIIVRGVGSSYIVRQHRYIPSQPHMTREMLRGGSHLFGSNQTVRRPGP